MKMKLKYGPLAIAATVVNAIALIGTYLLYSPLSSASDALSNNDYSAMSNMDISSESMSTVMILFFVGIVATAVVAIILAVFFVYEERKMAILASCVMGVIEFVLFLNFFDSIMSTAINGLGSVLSGSTDTTALLSSMIGSLQIALIVTLLGCVFNVLILLQMYHVIHLSFLQPYTPCLACDGSIPHQQTTQSQNQNTGEGGEQS